MAWGVLVLAGLLEVVWAFSMKLSDGFSRPASALVTLLAMAASFALLGWAMRTLPLGTAYTVWTGIGALGAFVTGVTFLGESLGAMRLVAAAMILGGIVLMKLSAA